MKGNAEMKLFLYKVSRREKTLLMIKDDSFDNDNNLDCH